MHTVLDAAVFGVPNADLGEEVKAVVQLAASVPASKDLEERLLRFRASRLSQYKCPRSIDSVAELPRHENGKLDKKQLREAYLTRAGD
ncbi:hypothetical protein [Rhodococcus sp. ACS1]|uniref:AMP-binding enzyme n=1 Tax=Rhodococcus sp. ACS1 TaxID=2028570 RepID=UPI0015C6C69B|nr:hypothetical protein [Rhodococcus sp. ACS1]